MKVFEILCPVLVMIVLGCICNKTKVVTRKGVDEIKFLVTKVMLPAAVYHALATVNYTADIFFIDMVIFIMLVISFFVSFLFRPLFAMPYKKYVPYMMCVYEAGMIAYPLYMNLCGPENLSKVAMLDIAGIIFGFSIYTGSLAQINSDKGIDVKKLCMDCFKNPVFDAAVIGLFLGVTGIYAAFLETGAGKVFNISRNMLVSPLSAMILFVVGYDLNPDVKLLRVCIKSVILRVIFQTALCLGVLTVIHLAGIREKLLDLAVIIFMSSPATFSIQSFIHEEEGSVYAATFNSLYTFVSIAVYAIAGVLM